MTRAERKALNPNGDFYVTSFCNFPHRLSTGRPIEHECYILNPDALVLEYQHGAQAVLDSGIGLRIGGPIRGRKLRGAA